MRRPAAAVALLLASPLLLAYGVGVWNPPAAWLEPRILGLLGILSGPSDAWPGLFVRGRAIPLFLAFGAIVAALARWRSAPVALGLRAVEEGAAALGLLASLGFLAVAVGLDRGLFWMGLLLASVGSPRGAASSGPVTRGFLASSALGLAWLVGTTLLEGPGMHSPAFGPREFWLDGPLGTPLGGALSWGAPLLLLLLGRRLRPLERLVLPLYALATGLAAPSAGRALAEVGSGLGLLAAASRLGPALRAMAPRALGLSALGPRALFGAALPLLCWGGLCGARGLTVLMWTAPGALPPGVERLDDRRDVFSVAVDGDDVLYTDRESDDLVRIRPDGSDQWHIEGEGGVGLEEVGGPFDGGAWVSVAQADRGGLMRVDYATGPGPMLPVDGCWISSWQPLPGPAVEALSGEPGDVLIGCEASPFVWVLRPSEVRLVHALMLDDEVEETAFAPDGRSFWSLGLWAGDSLEHTAWPGGERLPARLIGGFNWTLAVDPRRDLVYVGRFFEGTVLAFDARTLRLVRRLPFAFGLRALLLEPRNDLLWGAAAYSGLVIARPAGGGPARSWALCGQSRDLAADARGRVIVATDCGVFRIDPAVR